MNVNDLSGLVARTNWRFTPLAGKRPILTTWQNGGLRPEQMQDAIADGANCGLVLGRVSDGVVDVDIDEDDALPYAEVFLPQTGIIFGRTSRPRTHRLYKVGDPGRRVQFKAPDGSMLIEIRGDGHQTMFPGSIHPDGDVVEFQECGEPGHASWEELERQCAKVASATLIAPFWAKGQRHSLALCIAGTLCRAGWLEEEVESFVDAIANMANDEELSDRTACVRTTYERAALGSSLSDLHSSSVQIPHQITSLFMKWLKVAQSVSKTTEIVGPWIMRPTTDIDLAELFSSNNKDHMIYADIDKQWFFRKNGVFSPVSVEFAKERVIDFIKALSAQPIQSMSDQSAILRMQSAA